MQVALLVDDDSIFRSRLAIAVRDRNWACHEADSGKDALRLALMHSPNMILLDLRLANESGLDLIHKLKVMSPNSRIIILTGYGSIATAVRAVQLGAHQYLTKPADADQVMESYHALPGEAPPRPEESSAPSLARVEYEHIQRVLADCDGNISKAARILGLHRRSLQRKLFKNPPVNS
jgi:two-component system, response regulator RegA